MVERCPTCGNYYEIENNDPDVIWIPWPHIVCDCCGERIPLFQGEC